MPASPSSLPVLVLRSTVVLPRQVAVFEVSRPQNVRVLESGDELFAAMPILKPRLAVAARNLAPVTVVCRLLGRVQLPGGTLRVTVQGLERVAVEAVETLQGGFRCRLSPIGAEAPPEPARLAAVTERLQRLLASNRPDESADVLALNTGDPWRLIDLVRAAAGAEYGRDLALLLEDDPVRRLEGLASELERPIRHLGRHGGRRKTRGAGRAKAEDKELVPKWRGTRAHLGDAEPQELEVRSFEERVALSPMSSAARHEALREIVHFRRCRPGSSEAATIRDYLEWMIELPWDFDHEPPPVDFETVEEVLSASHTGLRDVKDRVVEHLAVRLLARRAHGTVLCFLGPPGTGKSSMGRAVAEALGRPFAQIPGGTVTEEEQLRGHPHRHGSGGAGVVLQSIHRAGRVDPVILIDEIDKLELGGSGTSGGSLLDILDPDQNAEFLDNYLGVPYDLSRCIFIVTANDRDDIAESVLDRLEIIEFSGFTEGEKLAIARDHLLPKARASHGLERQELRVTPAAMRTLIRNYTEEAGVRHLQRLLDSLARKAAVAVVRGEERLVVKKADLLRRIGPAVVDEEMRPQRPAVGVATGLAWTSAGGALLPIEALAMPGSGRTILTGLLGDVMRESVQTAMSFVRTRFKALDIQPDALDSLDLHLHFPSGSTPKDGPSAGVAVAAALISLMARVPVRHDVAMTGEVSLHGNVLPIGGLKEKLLAAVRAGMHEVVVPERNRDEVLRLPGEIRDKLVIHLIAHVQEAFDLVLARPLPGRGTRSAPPRQARRRRTARSARQKRRREDR